MYAIAIALLGAMLFAWSLATTAPQEIDTRTQVTADSLAANFWVYRGALVAYQNANFGAAGVISPADLQKYLPTGYQTLPLPSSTPSTPLWAHYFQNGILYTYSTIATTAACQLPPLPPACLPPATVDAIANRNGRSLMIGIAQNNLPMTMTSVFNLQNSPPATFLLPSLLGIPVIPPGALVVVGN